MKFIFLTDNPFPIGYAGTNRIKGYILGLTEQGNDCEVVIFKPVGKKHFHNVTYKGFWRNIPFIYPGKVTKRNCRFIKRRWDDFIGFLKSYIYVFKTLLFKRNCKLIFYGTYPIFEFLILILCKISGVSCMKEINEHPEILLSSKRFRHLSEYFFLKINTKLYSGLLLMTSKLEEYFKNYGISSDKLLLINNFVDFKRFEKKKSDENKPYIFFAGCLKEEKDGLFTLLSVFKNIIEKYNDLKLIVAGYGDNNVINGFENYIKKNSLQNKVINLGEISSEEIPSLISGAKLLVLPRPKTLQSEFGFPTKLLEYIASKKPVICSNVGNISEFFKDESDILFYQPGEINMLEEKINFVLQNYDKALIIAQKGYDLAQKSFNYFIETKKVIEFFHD